MINAILDPGWSRCSFGQRSNRGQGQASHSDWLVSGSRFITRDGVCEEVFQPAQWSRPGPPSVSVLTALHGLVTDGWFWR